ncbi:hypothetical protein B484DRAFT_480147 [Ochromonadaceae sp. CCMP2298]|nr:hypothetical protein B484DRAFT_480147 [Ochromonadaceae sp. CCMP2298]
MTSREVFNDVRTKFNEKRKGIKRGIKRAKQPLSDDHAVKRGCRENDSATDRSSNISADRVFQDIAKASQSSDGSRGQEKNAWSGSGKSRSSSGSSSSNNSSNSSSNREYGEGAAADKDEDEDEDEDEANDNDFYSK